MFICLIFYVHHIHVHVIVRQTNFGGDMNDCCSEERMEVDDPDAGEPMDVDNEDIVEAMDFDYLKNEMSCSLMDWMSSDEEPMDMQDIECICWPPRNIFDHSPYNIII